jgi:hypothetical protein
MLLFVFQILPSLRLMLKSDSGQHRVHQNDLSNPRRLHTQTLQRLSPLHPHPPAMPPPLRRTDRASIVRYPRARSRSPVVLPCLDRTPQRSRGMVLIVMFPTTNNRLHNSLLTISNTHSRSHHRPRPNPRPALLLKLLAALLRNPRHTTNQSKPPTMHPVNLERV